MMPGTRPRKSRRVQLAMSDKAAIDSVHTTIAVSSTTGQLSESQLVQAKSALDTAGYVILARAALRERSRLDALRDKMAEDYPDLYAETRTNYSPGHVQHSPPRDDPSFVFRDVVANAAVEQLIASVLGERTFLSLYSGNTNLPGSKQQPTHADIGHASLKQREPHSLTVNIPLVDTTEDNGSIQVWPGTHLDPKLHSLDQHMPISSADVEARKRDVPPVRVNTCKGDVLVRDPRLWHAGMENVSGMPRTMLALMYEKEGTQPEEPRCTAPRFGSRCLPAFEGSKLANNVEFKTGEVG